MFGKKGPCLRTKDYLSKNWNITQVSEQRNKPSAGFFQQSTFMSPLVFWEVSCGSGLGLSLVVRDYSISAEKVTTLFANRLAKSCLMLKKRFAENVADHRNERFPSPDALLRQLLTPVTGWGRVHFLEM
jgi:hypothetical protein